MRRMTFYIVVTVVMTLGLAVLGAGGASAAIGDQLILNAGLESGSGGTPSSWSFESWSTGNTIRSTGAWSTDAHSGARSVRVDVTAYGSDGDAKWMPQPFAVTGGKYYVLSDWYKANRSSAISVEYWTAGQSLAGDGQWANLFSGIAPASAWTQYQTGFTMPAGAVYATFAHFIAGVGWLETDDYSVSEQVELPGFSSPMISLTFDDGSEGWFNDARLKLNAKGFKTTQYIPTLGLTTNPPDSFLMTKAQITQIAGEGHEVGAHSVTHPDLTTVSDSQLKTELVNSKATLEAIPGAGTVTDFAYPYGTYDARVIAALQAAGYTSGRSVEEGYNSKLDLAPYDIRVQNMTPSVSLATFQGWVDYAKAHNYWLVIVYHEVRADDTPRCRNVPTDPDPCVGDYDTTDSQFQSQLNYITTAGLGGDVMTVKHAMEIAAGPQGQPPVAGTAALSPAQPATNATLTATAAEFSDPDGDALTYTYTWKVNGNVVATTTSSAITATFDLSQAGHGDDGDTVSVTVTASDGHGNTSAGVSASVTVANTAPTVGSVSISPSAPSTNATLTATPSGFTDADGDALAYHYQWSLNGTAVVGATAPTFTPSGLVRADVIGVTVSADDGHGGTTATVSASVTVADTAPTAGSVSITPTSPQHGATVTATPTGFTDADGDALTYHYQWSLNGAVVAGATASTFALSSAVRGDSVGVTASADDGHGGTSASVNTSVTVANTAPTSGSVSISPSAPSGNATLTATPSGFADLDRDTLTYHYQWSVGGAPVVGATGATYTLAGVAGGTVVGVTVSADDGHGGTAGPVSASVTVSANRPPVAGTVTVSPSSPTAGTTLTAAPGGFSDPDGDALTYTYAWFRNAVQVAGVTGPTLAGSNVAAGDVIRVEVRASDGHGSTSAAATATVTVSSVDRIAPTINITSPVATATYRRGQVLVVQFTCSDSGSRVASCTATLTRAGSTRIVTSGQSVQLQRGSYTFKVNARDRAGNTAAKTVNITVR